MAGYEGGRDAAGQRHGVGKAVFSNGDTYEGMYVHGKRNGLGMYTFSAGGRYEGSYKQNKKHGRGKMTYLDGSTYTGDWKDDQRHGNGIYIYANGDSYDGGWKHGERCGKGVYFFATHKCQFFGVWDGGNFAFGAWAFADGTTFAGHFSDGPLARPVSRSPACLVTRSSSQPSLHNGTFKGGKWSSLCELSATKLHNATGALPRSRLHRHRQSISLESLTRLYGELPSVAEPAPHTTDARKVQRIVIYGPPGAGRSTQADLIAQKYGLDCIASGEVLQRHVAAGDSIGTEAQKFMNDGDFVPDKLILRAMLPLVQDSDAFLLSGFPRTAEQAAAFLEFGIDVDAVIVLDAPDRVLAERAVMRHVDPQTGAKYHITQDYIPSDVKGRLVPSQVEGNIEKRIALYRKHCTEVLSKFPSATVHSVDGDRHKEEVFMDIDAIICGKEPSERQRQLVNYNVNRSETVVKKLAWSLRSQHHSQKPEIDVDNSHLYDPDPDMLAKRRRDTSRPPLVILHFNDVYEIKEGKQEPVGGAPRIAGKLHEFDSQNPLVLFSGDALNPSLLSQSTQGSHMIEVLNALGVACSVIGNHDLDFGVENMAKQMAASDFPWLCSNCWHKETGEPLAGGIEACIIQVRARLPTLPAILSTNTTKYLTTIVKVCCNPY